MPKEKLTKLQDMVETKIVQSVNYQKTGYDHNLKLMILLGYSFLTKGSSGLNSKVVGKWKE